MATIKLGALLIKANVLNETQVQAALAEQKKWGGRLGEVLVRMNMLSEDLLARALAKQLSMPAVNLDAIESIPQIVRDRIPAKMARDLHVVPIQLKDENRTLVVAMSEPQNLNIVDKLRAVSSSRIAPTVATLSALDRAVARFYGASPGHTPSAPVPSPFRVAPGPAEPMTSAYSMDDLPPNTGTFQILDAQGQTKLRPGPPVEGDTARMVKPRRFEESARPSPAPPPPASGAKATVGERETLTDSRSELTRFEEMQLRDTNSIRALVELLIEKGYFTREEFNAKMRR